MQRPNTFSLNQKSNREVNPEVSNAKNGAADSKDKTKDNQSSQNKDKDDAANQEKKSSEHQEASPKDKEDSKSSSKEDQENSEIEKAMRYEYYVHYLGVDRRLDRWVTEQFILVDPDEIHRQETKINKDEEQRVLNL